MENHWAIGKKFRFETNHPQLHPNQPDPRAQDHCWIGIVYISSQAVQALSKAGMKLDEAEIKTYLYPLLDHYLDRHCLQQATGPEQPTSQALAKWIFDQLVQQGLPGLLGVKIHNATHSSTCLYTESVRTGFQLAMASNSIAIA